MRKFYFVTLLLSFLSFGQSAIAQAVTEKPEGTSTALTRSAQSWVYDEYYVNPPEVYPLSKQAGELIEEADGKTVWLKNPVMGAVGTASDFWIKGEKKANGDLTFSTPQSFNDTKGYNKTIYFSRMKSDAEKGYVADDKDITFKWDEATSTYTLDEPTSKEIVIGLRDDSQWLYFGDYDVKMVASGDKPTVVPASAVFEPWVIKSNGTDEIYQEIINVAIDGTDIYIKGFDKIGLPEAAIKGTISGNKVAFKSQQLMAVKYGWQNIYMINGSVSDGKIKGSTDDLTFSYDAAAKRLYNASGAMLFNQNKDELSSLSVIDYFISPELSYYGDPALTPSTPEIAGGMEKGSSKNGYVSFKLPTVSEDGKILNPEKLYYNVYYDNDESEPILFEPDAYTTLSAATTDIPYLMDDNTYFTTAYGVGLQFRFLEDVKAVGIQAVYKGGDETRRSKIAWRQFASTGIDNATTASDAVSVEYRDLAGRSVSRPQAGIYIKTTTYRDGKRKSVKTIIK